MNPYNPFDSRFVWMLTGAAVVVALVLFTLGRFLDTLFG